MGQRCHSPIHPLSKYESVQGWLIAMLILPIALGQQQQQQRWWWPTETGIGIGWMECYTSSIHPSMDCRDIIQSPNDCCYLRANRLWDDWTIGRDPPEVGFSLVPQLFGNTSSYNDEGGDDDLLAHIKEFFQREPLHFYCKNSWFANKRYEKIIRIWEIELNVLKLSIEKSIRFIKNLTPVRYIDKHSY